MGAFLLTSSLQAINVFDPYGVDYVLKDSTKNTYLFQSNIIWNSKREIDLKDIREGMDRATNRTLPSRCFFSIITLLDPGVDQEHDALEVCYRFFAKNDRSIDGFDVPLQEQFYLNKQGYWYTARCHPHFELSTPTNRYTTWDEFNQIFENIPTSTGYELFTNQKSYGVFTDFDKVVDYLQEEMSTKRRYPTAVLVHSRFGKVRTAALIAAYLMKYKCQTIEKAYNMAVLDEDDLDNPHHLKIFLYYYRQFLDHGFVINLIKTPWGKGQISSY